MDHEIESLIADAPLSAHLATTVADRPHVAPVWYDYDDGYLRVLTGGKKLRNIDRNPQVAVSIEQAPRGALQDSQHLDRLIGAGEFDGPPVQAVHEVLQLDPQRQGRLVRDHFGRTLAGHRFAVRPVDPLLVEENPLLVGRVFVGQHALGAD
ncbi:MAG: pyridoxamine 5'-phosphate oxidase family protein, partial [Euryarchaeota archaeon]|nr:pyridoxamine 5'-phosphate oxidase family protein [Euryarchaeota archaeon]